MSLRVRATEATGMEHPVVAIDGKSDSRSHDRKNGLGALHAVSAWASKSGLSLGQAATDKKSNEIAAIPELLWLIDTQGAILSVNAMGTPKETAKQIIKGGGNFVLALNGNQGNLS